MRELPLALAPLTAYRQFIVFKTVPSAMRPGKTDKLPIDWRSGAVVSAHDPAIWLDSATAIATANAWGAPFGVGFVFTEADPFWFLDIDNCLMPDGQWAPHAQQVCAALPGCAIEVSGSGQGLHLFGIGRPPVHKIKNEPLKMEFYHAGRFAALTGDRAQGSVALDFTAVLSALVALYFPPDADTGPAEWTAGPAPEWNGIKDDAELIRAALASRTVASTFGNKASFADLWFADERELAKAFPDQGRPYNESQADGSLAQHLAFWTGKDCERILRLMRMSKLVRDKWEREDYLPRTILGAVARQIDVFQASGLAVSPSALPMAPASPTEPVAPATVAIEGSRIKGLEGQRQLFAGVTYITDTHRALIPGGHVLKPEQFRVVFGGYSFQMDANNEKMTRDAWEAFTQSQILVHPKVNGSCFRPDLPAGAVVIRNGQSFVNTYVPMEGPRLAGDPTPFLEHLAKVLPDKRDQAILLSYMAAVCQRKGLKFQWAPLLQGVEGNGKTLFTYCVAHAIGRRYTHFPRASQLQARFNSWMVGKLFYAVEDIYVPDARREIIEELKPMITGDNLEIEAKGIDQTSADICGNFMFNSNHRDAIKKTGNDRRFCVLFSAQQEASDLQRDGMHGNYFPRLYTWLRADGYAIVSDFLYRYDIPAEFDPAAECQRAPISSTTGEAIQASTGTVEQEILEAVAQELPGFAGGWISSIYLTRLLENMGLARKIAHSRRTEMLDSMGYIVHPALKEGRTNNPVLPDGGKPRLYIRRDALAIQLANPVEVAKYYEATNNHRAEPAYRLPFKGHLAGS